MQLVTAWLCPPWKPSPFPLVLRFRSPKELRPTKLSGFQWVRFARKQKLSPISRIDAPSRCPVRLFFARFSLFLSLISLLHAARRAYPRRIFFRLRGEISSKHWPNFIALQEKSLLRSNAGSPNRGGPTPSRVS